MDESQIYTRMGSKVTMEYQLEEDELMWIGCRYEDESTRDCLLSDLRGPNLIERFKKLPTWEEFGKGE